MTVTCLLPSDGRLLWCSQQRLHKIWLTWEKDRSSCWVGNRLQGDKSGRRKTRQAAPTMTQGEEDALEPLGAMGLWAVVRFWMTLQGAMVGSPDLSWFIIIYSNSYF